MIKVVCDCCEKEFKLTERSKQGQILASNKDLFTKKDIDWDLCPKCYRNILKDMKLIFNDRRRAK